MGVCGRRLGVRSTGSGIRTLHEHVRQATSPMPAWEEVALSLAARVRLDPRVQLSSATLPPQLQGFVAGIIAFLRTDPTSASVVFPMIIGDDFRTIVLADGISQSAGHLLALDIQEGRPLRHLTVAELRAERDRLA
jgi:hypothetical protein